MGTVTKDRIINIKKLKIPQNTEPKKIKERVNKKLALSILLKKNGDCKIWSMRQINDRTIRPVIKPLL